MSSVLFAVGNFSGKTGQSAARWLKKVTYELQKSHGDSVIPPKDFLRAVEFLLSDEAEDWIESHREAGRLLSIDEPSQDDVARFRTLLEKKFPAKPKDTSRKGFVAELRELRQEPEETITMYYKRVVNMMVQVDVRDRPTSIEEDDLSFLEESMLDNILEAFTRGFNDEYITKKTIQGLGDPARSVLNTYNQAESVRLSQLALKKATESKNQSKQRDFLWDIVRRNMSAEKIEALYASSEHEPFPDEWKAELLVSAKSKSNSETAYRPSAPSSYVPRQQTSSAPPYVPPQKSAAPSYPPRQNVPRTWPPRNENKGNPFQTRALPDASTSKNRFINGKSTFNLGLDGPLCVRCGELGHIGPECIGNILPAWEQSYLRNIVFGENTPQVYFAKAAYGIYDGHCPPYGTNDVVRPRIPNRTPSNPYQLGARSVTVGMEKLSVGSCGFSGDLPTVEALLGEGSGPNKRAHVEDVLETPDLASTREGLKQPSSNVRNKRKVQKRVGKKIDPQPMVGMFDEVTGTYDKPVSIRQLLKKCKIEMSVMDLCAISTEASKEVKRLFTRVPKKRIPRSSVGPSQSQDTFNPATLPSSYPDIHLPMQPIAPHGFTVPAQSYPHQQASGPMPPQLFHPIPIVQPPTIPPHSQPEILSVQAADDQTRFLHTLRGAEKAFRINCTIKSSDGKDIPLGKATTQADQGSEMNVISVSLLNHLHIPKFSLAKIGFKGLTMQTADQRQSPLDYWTKFWITTEGITRFIHCFVSPQTTLPGSAKSGHFSLLLGLPWLHSVNAHISIRDSKISVGDPALGEIMRDIVGPEMTFCSEHTLLMYPSKSLSKVVSNQESDEESISSEAEYTDSEDELSDIEEVPRKPDFL